MRFQVRSSDLRADRWFLCSPTLRRSTMGKIMRGNLPLSMLRFIYIWGLLWQLGASSLTYGLNDKPVHAWISQKVEEELRAAPGQWIDQGSRKRKRNEQSPRKWPTITENSLAFHRQGMDKKKIAAGNASHVVMILDDKTMRQLQLLSKRPGLDQARLFRRELLYEATKSHLNFAQLLCLTDVR